jgi:hypothetical protein
LAKSLHISKSILLQVPTGSINFKSFNLEFIARTLFRTKNDIYFSNGLKTYKIGIEDTRLIRVDNKNLKGKLVSANDNYICNENNDQVIFFLLI